MRYQSEKHFPEHEAEELGEVDESVPEVEAVDENVAEAEAVDEKEAEVDDEKEPEEIEERPSRTTRYST